MPIPIIDIFAGPGGLSEGFSSVVDSHGKRVYQVVLSAEMNPWAHQTLTIRSFFRQFPHGEVPDEYFAYLKQQSEESLAELRGNYPKQWGRATAEAQLIELSDETTPAVIATARARLQGRDDWVLIGGPPCQAYSLAGRSRNAELIKTKPEEWEKDARHTLYKQYLRFVNELQPAVFVMENVKGLLSATLEGKSVYSLILSDLASAGSGYTLHSCVVTGDENTLKATDYVVCAEKYGVPQARHRVIIIGVRSDIDTVPSPLSRHGRDISVENAIGDLPSLRPPLSRVSRGRGENPTRQLLDADSILRDVETYVNNTGRDLFSEDIDSNLAGKYDGALGSGGNWVMVRSDPNYLPDWFRPYRDKMHGVPNHEARPQMLEDLQRYLYASACASATGSSPRLADFPSRLLPHHRSATVGENGRYRFADRFRVQAKGLPSTTITSHISKDGHYYIHYDYQQPRSLTVREAARLQTFPDDYLFMGPRTHQYHQVGNAVPPFLAHQIAVNVLPALGKMSP